MKRKLSIDPFPVAPQPPLSRAEPELHKEETDRSALMLAGIAIGSLVLVAGVTYFRMDVGAGSQQAEFVAPATPGAAQLQVPQSEPAAVAQTNIPQPPAVQLSDAQTAETTVAESPVVEVSLAPRQTIRPPAARPATQSIQDVVDQSQVDAPVIATAETVQQVVPQPEPVNVAQPDPTPAESAPQEPRRMAVLAIVDEETGEVQELALDDLQAIANILKSPDTAREQPSVARTQQPSARAAQARTQPAPQLTAGPSCVDALRDIAENSTVFFYSGGTQLTSRDVAQIRNIGAAMANCPEAIMQVSGHSDPSGDETTNIAVSWARADNTIAAFQSMGFDTSRMDPVGFGSRIPVAEGDNAGQDDRRVEFQVMEKR